MEVNAGNVDIYIISFVALILIGVYLGLVYENAKIKYDFKKGSDSGFLRRNN